MITWTKRLLLTCTLIALLATNLLALTSTAVYAALSGFMTTALGVATATDALKNIVAFGVLRIAQYIKIGRCDLTTITHLLTLKMLRQYNSIVLPRRESHYESHLKIHQAKTLRK